MEMDKTPYQNKLLNPELDNKLTLSERVKKHVIHLDKRIKAVKEIDPNNENLAIMEMRKEHGIKFLK